MPAPTPNIGQLITRSNTGPSASVSGSVTHSPATLTTHSGDFSTTSAGQVVQARNITGILRIKHNNVKVIDCKARGVVIDNDREGIECRWCEFGNQNGNDSSNGGHTCFSGGGYLVYRTQVYGWIDLFRTRWGDSKIVECWIGPMYADPNAHGGDRAHTDPNQPHPPPGSVPFRSLLMQGNRIESFVFEPGENYLTRIGSIANEGGTAGFVNNEFGRCPNGVLRDNYIDGNYKQCLYIINGDNNTTNGNPTNHPTNPGVSLEPPAGWVVIDNIFKSRRGPGSSKPSDNQYGSTSFVNFGKAPTQSTSEPTVTWGRNVDADTGETLAAFYRTKQSTHYWKKTKDAGASSLYPTFYDTSTPTPEPEPSPTPSPSPVLTLSVTSPTDGTTHTSGTVTFVGGADSAQGDSAANYSYFQYHAIYTGADGNAVTAYLDRDRATNNTGFTFSTITDDGATFTDRSGVSHTILGTATLRITGERNDGTRPTGSVSVTFGDTTAAPPPTNIAFTPTMNALMTGAVEIDTATGGVDPDFIERVSRQVPATYRVRYIWRGKTTKREVVFSGGLPVYKGQA